MHFKTCYEGRLCINYFNDKGKTKENKTLGDVRYVHYLMVVMVSQMFAYVQTHQIIYVKYVQFFINYISVKLLKKIKKNVLHNLGRPDTISWKALRGVLKLL